MQDGLSTTLSGPSLQGHVHGGQQPVSGASIALYAAGTGGNGLGATNLLLPHIVTSDSSGDFSISSDYNCPTPTTQVYLVARGGNPGQSAGTNNTALVMMAALGNCSTLSSSGFIFVNEVTTAAAAWALSPFVGSGALVGSTPTNTTGLANAFAVANNLVNTTTGMATGTSLPPSSTTESGKLYALANSLASCVNSDGTTACAPLFSAATVGTSVPTNTLDAALSIVRNPAANITAVFNAGTAYKQFASALTTAPHDWTMSIKYGNCTASCGGLDDPKSVAIDAAGNAWVSNALASVVSEFSPSGSPLSLTGYPGAGLRESFGITIASTGHVWVTNQQSVTGAANSHVGSVSEFSSAGAELSGYGDTGGGLYYPQAAAADASGNVWFADYGSSSASVLNDAGSSFSYTSGGSGYGYNLLPFTSAVNIDANHYAWFAVQGGVVRVTLAGAVTSYSCCSDPAGIAIDQTGNIWVADYGAFAIVELNSGGNVLNRISSGSTLLAAQTIAVDGSGNVWAANLYGNSVTEVAGASATQLSPAAGFGVDAALVEPYGLAIDASGNIWVSSEGNSTLTQFVGLASPIATPLLGPPAKP